MSVNPASVSPAISPQITAMLETDAFSRWLGVSVLEVAPGRCVASMRIRADMVNGFGASHGGIVFSLADSAMAFACNSGPHVTVAIENHISYPAAVQVDDVLTARAEEESATGRLGFYRVTVRNQHNTTVALFTGTVYRTKRMHAPEAAP
jgi:acyl-CoA thioesterase